MKNNKCVGGCGCVSIILVVGMFDNKNILTLQLKVIQIILINVHPVERYLTTPIHNIPTDTQYLNLHIYHYNRWIYMYNSAVQST